MFVREPGRLITAMATPFRDDGSLDEEGAARLASHLVETGTETVLVNGTTGESPALSRDEKFRLFQAVRKEVGGRAPVMMGTGTYDTAESVRLTRQAEEAGADFILVVAPYYNKPPQEGLYQHFSAIAAATALPVMLYNVPTRTVTDILPETVIRLAETQNIFAIKEASGHINRTSEILSRARPGFRVYSGDDVSTLPMMSLGAHGVVSVASHVVGRQIHSLIEAHVCGEPEKAASIHRMLAPVFRALFITVSPIPLKAALRLLGLPGGGLRLPLIDASEAEVAAVREALEELNLLG
ncbi:MAG: 4-hydroxy-tetrahydrodipicolinate synthase [Chloroflexi bacterium]|nr:4-hydroxy-tetrahydrodipicolinate synthase [Chloroflexota bacterium]